MPQSALVQRVIVGTVVVDVCCRDGSRPEYHAVLLREQFAAEELLMLRDAVKQTERFIRDQEQLLIAAIHPGCDE